MQEQSESRTGVAPRPRMRDEFIGPPRPSTRARISMVAFVLLLVASLTISALSTADATPGISLVALGMLMLLGFAELMDPSQRRFIIAVRLSGLAIALLGFVIQMVFR